MKMKTLKIIAALDSYKGAVSSYDAGSAVKRGIHRRLPDCDVRIFSLGDGGEGTCAAFHHAGNVGTFRVSDTHGERIDAEYVLLDRNGVKTAMFDMAAAAGLHHSRRHGLNVRSATTAGVGEMIVQAVELGCREIIVGLGGSGTNDGGTGALARMGTKFFAADGREIDGTGGAEILKEIAGCDLSAVHRLLDGVKLTLLYDVAVPLTGENGASRMFSRQKGADEAAVEEFESAMTSYADICDAALGEKISERSGAGAAGGLGYGLSLAGGTLCPGAEYVLDFVGFREEAADADLIITGEGKTDRQTARGKLPFTVAKYAGDVPTVCLCGTFAPDEELYDNGFDAVFSIINAPSTLEESMKNTEALLENAAYNVAGLLAAIRKL